MFYALALQQQPHLFDDMSVPQQAAGLTSLFGIVVGLGTYSVVVRWHRKLILHRAPAETRSGSLPVSFLYGARAVLLVTVGFCAVMTFGLLPVIPLRGRVPSEYHRPIAAILGSGAIVFTLLAVCRAGLILPAAAVGDMKMTMRKSLAVTRGNSWRLLAGTALSAGPALTLNLLLNSLVRADANVDGGAISVVALLVLTMLLLFYAAIVQASFLSFCYLHFVSVEAPKDQLLQSSPTLA